MKVGTGCRCVPGCAGGGVGGATEESLSIKGLARAISYGLFRRCLRPYTYVQPSFHRSDRQLSTSLRDAAGDSSIGVLRDTLASESRQ